MKHFLFYCLIIPLASCEEKQTYRFKIAGDDGFSQPVPVVLDAENMSGLGLDLEDNLVLLHDDKAIPFQIDSEQKMLWFVHTPGSSAPYSIEKAENRTGTNAGIMVTKNDGDLQLSKGNVPLVTYRYGMTYPPEGVDSIFRKSGYIHPLLSPSGDTLTRIQPPDHYHHYGIWGPWTHTQIHGERIDFWNLAERQGTVLFDKFNSTVTGSVFAGFSAHQVHIDLTKEKEERTALNEDLEVKVWNLGRPDRYMFDYITTFSSPLENGILLEAYRYGGGIGMRFTERWKADNCSVLTSEGNDRLTADGTNARWCIVSGISSDGKGSNGILFMSHPTNRAHPEPMRVWPIDANNGRGDMFFEFCPIRHEEWNIKPHKTYRLKYRMLVFDGELNAEEAEAYWQVFSKESKIKIISNK